MSEGESRIAALLKAVGRRAGLAVVVLVSVAVGFLIHAALTPETAPQAASPRLEEVWICSMHPQIRQPNPGKCPICQMDLTLQGSSSGAEREFVTTPQAVALMKVQTAPVERKFVTAEVRMVGKIDYDETKLAYITSWAPGRLDRLYVDYTGVPVREGDHLVYIYSPQLLAAQEELIQAARSVRDMEDSDSQLVRESTEATLAAAREKLRLLGLTAEQVQQVERSGKVSEHLTIYSPTAGVVIEKHAKEGMYVNTGTRIYTIADLSGMWVRLEAYESDLAWLRYGQDVAFTTLAHPGQEFHGRISFIDPVLDPVTRTVKVRVNVPNEDSRLKPNMFVRAVVRSGVAAGGKVMAPDLAGKWISPMHPEIIKDEPGQCDVCGMDLVKAESLGYVSPEPGAGAPLVIPASAPLITGERAVVYVEAPNAEQPTYVGREVVLGPRAGGYYLVRSGLAEGERVVTRGNFKIDSALQIQAKPSMMSPAGGVAPAGHQHHNGQVHTPAPPRSAAPAEDGVVNVRCPIMDTPIDPAAVPANLTRMWRGRRIGFCCAGCPEMWDKLSDAQKQEKLAGAMPRPGGAAPEGHVHE